MSYAEQLDYLERLIKALEVVIDFMMEHPLDHPLGAMAYNTVLLGVTPNINVNCPHDKDCQVKASIPYGGMSDALDVIEEAVKFIEFEMLLENVESPPDPAFYDI